MLLLIYIIIIVIIFLWLKLWMYWWLRGITSVGYPPPIGCLLPVWTGRITIPEMTQMALRRYPNTPVIGTWILFKPVLLVRDLNLVHQIMSEDFHLWSGRGFNDDPDLEPLSQHLVNLEGKRWKLVRSWLSSSFGIGLKARYAVLTSEANKVSCLMSSKDNFNILKITQDLAISVLSRLAIGLNDSPPMIKELIHEAFVGSIWVAVRSAFRLTCPFVLAYIGCKRYQSKHELSFIDLAEGRFQNKQLKQDDILQVLIDSYKEYKETFPYDDEINKKLVFSNAFGVLAAGYDTTASNLALGFLELARNPDVQNKLHNEVHKVLAHHGEPNQAAIQEMHYLDDVVSEILRLFPSVSITTRVSTSSTSIGNLEVPPGFRVLVPIYGIHRDPANFTNPNTFDPDRFSRDQIHRLAFMPFGKGPRICIGWRLAKMIIKLSIISVIKDYTIELSPETKMPVKFATHSIFLGPKHPVILKLRQRN